jgi:serine/threonine protein phosphatase PrpC
MDQSPIATDGGSMVQPLMFDVGTQTDAGVRRQVNEDSLAVPTDLPPQLLAQKGYLFVVADGIGGHTAGKTASDLAIRVVMQQYYADPSTDVRQSLVQAIQAANAEIHRQAQDLAYAGMGTTVVAAVVRGSSLTVAHVGDSRAYLLRGEGMQVLTQDHTWVAAQVRNGLLTPEQARQHDQRHVLIRSLGREPQVEVDVSRTTLGAGDGFLLCSDGLWELVDKRTIQQLLSTQPAQAAAQQLIDLANQAGGPDNITAVIVKLPASSAPLPLSGPVDRAKGLLAGQQRRFSTLPAQRRQLVIVIAAILSLAALVCVVTFVLWKPLPSAPSHRVAPVRYPVIEGDTLESVAGYFQVSTDTLAAGFATGQPVTLTPGNYAFLFSGQVVRLDQPDGAALLEVSNRFERYKVAVDLRAEGTSVSADATPEEGNTVTLLARPGDEGTVEALAVDVWQGDEWATWYRQGTDSKIWVYSAFHDQLVPASGEYSTLKGQPVLLLGSWSQADSGFQLQWDEQDLYLFGRGEGEVYGSWLPVKDRQPLTERFAAPPTSIPGDDGQPPAIAPGVEGTIPLALSSPVSGTVTTQVGLQIRSTPSTQFEPVDTIDYGGVVKIACQIDGEIVEGDATWYRVANPDKQPGYVSAHYVGLDEGLQREDIAPCGAHD